MKIQQENQCVNENDENTTKKKEKKKEKHLFNRSDLFFDSIQTVEHLLMTLTLMLFIFACLVRD